MSTSEARKIANQANSLKSTGHLSIRGKEASRANAYKHGMTGAGIVLPNEDAAEIDRRIIALEAELKPSGELGRALVRRVALHSVRMERGASQEAASLSKLIRQAEEDFVAPEGLDEATVAQLRAEACGRAMFDPSREATLARQHEAAAERGFFKALKELRQLEKETKASAPKGDDAIFQKTMASFFQMENKLNQVEARLSDHSPITPLKTRDLSKPGYQTPIDDIFDVPISIGRRR
jgi:hypothetical protein